MDNTTTRVDLEGRKANDPLGIYMAGFTRQPGARERAETQRTLSLQAGDTDGAAWWDKVLAYLTVTGR